MSFSFGMASVANTLNGVAADIAYGTRGVNGIIGGVYDTTRAIGGLVDIFSGNYNNSSGYGFGGFGDTASFTGGAPTQWLTKYISEAYSENGLLQFIYQKLFSDISPDISGYTLLFMVPPELSGYLNLGNQNYERFGSSFIGESAKIVPLLATNFTPPTIQLNTSALSGSSGTQHYASELNITDTMSVTFVDTINLDVYSFHSTWLQYIYHVLEGSLEPDMSYIKNRMIDYTASFYFVKFQPDAQTIQYVGKAVGCFPREMPSAEVLGNRNSSELTTLTFNYTVSDYREATMLENGNWLFSELQGLILSQYNGR